ncbi:iron complex outermembrane receptor protein [Mesocricetibacter intestinalis]|uniref:Iron complex outermembrane receptor protein n=1 Tax=Mesocricetibacter intestinalis TaxID=1521930 RepID=A0A4R6VBE9_9PAST|nr:TonB-dependent siderophore receptor [Mesocricetibacter intestinalis]TDQ57136.1 iron complex outermembrane receptor protein [Mesocricetibacter intestinalis]
MQEFKLSVASTLVFAVLSSSAYAESPQTADKASSLETIDVVTEQAYEAIVTENTRDYSSFAATVGTKSPASIREIPQSISIITNQQIRDRDVRTFDQLAAKTPGLRVLANDDGRSSVYARGYEYSEYNIDGLPAQMQSIVGTLPNLIAFDRVEIMRGPSGLFDSSGEMGGIVNFVRKRPSKEFKGSLSAGYGSYQKYNADADISGPLNESGSIRGRLVAQTNGESPKPAEKNNHHETLYAALDWDLDADTTLGLGYLFQQRELTPNNGLPAWADGSLLSLPNHTFVGARWNKFTMKSHDFFADLKHRFATEGVGKIGLRYSDREADSNYAFSGSALNANNITKVTGLATEVKQRSFALDASYSQPFKLGNRTSDFVLGADYNHFKYDYDQARASLGSLDYRNFSSLSYVDIMSNARNKLKGYSLTNTLEELSETGLYGKLVLRPLDPLSVIVGGRLGHYKIESGSGADKESQSKTKATGYAGVVFDINTNHSLYASYSSLYTPQTDTDINGKLLKARKGTQLEGGYKGAFFNEALNLRFSVYRLKDVNAAAPSIPTDAKSPSVALGERVMQGFEAEISGNITDQWRIHAGYSYLDTELVVPTKSDVAIYLMPRHSGNIWTTYDINEKFTLGAGMNAMSEVTSSTGIKAGGYTTFDAMMSYAFSPKLKGQLNVDNLLNRNYYVRAGSVSTFNIPGKGRTIFASIRYTF